MSNSRHLYLEAGELALNNFQQVRDSNRNKIYINSVNPIKMGKYLSVTIFLPLSVAHARGIQKVVESQACLMCLSDILLSTC